MLFLEVYQKWVEVVGTSMNAKLEEEVVSMAARILMEDFRANVPEDFSDWDRGNFAFLRNLIFFALDIE